MLESELADAAAAPCVVRADRDKLRQILVNLLHNAIKFTPHGGVIRLGAMPSEKPGMVSIAVRDTGIGIDAEKLETIFAPFVQLGRRLSTHHEGIGLGLAISRDLARGMGGDLTAVSTAGTGAVFILTLPSA
jgi:signal transduction histidine kinase